MIRTTLLFVVALLLPAFAHAESRLLREPTYSHGKVAFSYLGDIWVAKEDGSQITRLTVHRARDVLPRFSPDGKTIAFSSNRAGNYDVYVIPVAGGKPRQLTFNSADDYIVGWSPDGRKILFSSSRNMGAFPGVATLFEVPLDGGMEQPLATDWGSWASYSPDGAKLAFTRHPGVWSRKHYRGSYNADLWLLDVASRSFSKLADPDYQGNYLWPMFGRDGQIYFVADRLPDEKHAKWGGPEVMQSRNNIWKISEHGGKLVQVTHHADGNLFFPSMSADGRTIVYEDNFGLWKLDVASGQSSEIRIDIQSDDKENEVELRTIQNEADSFNLSPSSKRAAIATHGEIFTIATDRGEVQRVTETPWREKLPRWSPDGRWIALVSDRTGREEVYIADELGRQLKRLSDADCDKSALVWAPDSKSLLWSGSDHKLRRVEIESGKTEQIAANDASQIGTPQFSPDGKWISYSKEDKLLRSRVYLKPLDGGTERAIESDQFVIAGGAKWTSDGKTLLLVGGVGAPGMASLNSTTQQLYSVPLAHVAKNPDDRDVDTEAQAAAAESPHHGQGAAGKAAADAKVEVKIEWDGLAGRIRQLTHLAGSVSNLVPAPDSRTYAFIGSDDNDEDDGPTGRPALYTIAADGSHLTTVAKLTSDSSEGAPHGHARFGGIGDPQWSHDGRSIFYMQGGGIYAVAVSQTAGEESGSSAADSGGRGRGRFGRGGEAGTESTATPTATPRRIPFTVRMEIDHVAERRQVFEEAWRVMKYRFYDPAMHGVNWAAAKETYEPLLADLADTEELHNVVMQMIGELNSSHTGIFGGYEPDSDQERIETRYPGFNLEPDATAAGYYKVSYIYKKGPADHDYVNLKVGNYVLAVNGRELKTGDNLWRLFNLLPGRKFEFMVNAKPQLEGAWHVSLVPLSPGAQAELEYDRWLEGRKEMVAKQSNGQIGYLHIRAMDAPSLRRFERDLIDNLGKKALIIDERFNGGGGIDQELLEILNQRKKYESYRSRDSVEVPRPVQTFYGPMAVLQNERSASDAEMFPEGFRTLGLGKLVGMPTYGAVIGTGSYRLLDGSSIRVPSVGVYTAKGQDFENYGVVPDVRVDNTPADFLASRDRQIEAAVELLRSETK